MQSSVFEIFYDAECPVCRRIAKWIEKNDTKGMIVLSNLNTEGYMLELLGVELGEAYKEVHAVRQTTSINYVVTKGPDVARRIFDILGYHRIFKLSNMPVLRHAFDAGFCIVNKYRHLGW